MSPSELKDRLPEYVFATQQQPISVVQPSGQELGLSLSLNQCFNIVFLISDIISD